MDNLTVARLLLSLSGLNPHQLAIAAELPPPNTASWLKTGISTRLSKRMQHQLLGYLGYLDGTLLNSRVHKWRIGEEAGIPEIKQILQVTLPPESLKAAEIYRFRGKPCYDAILKIPAVSGEPIPLLIHIMQDAKTAELILGPHQLGFGTLYSVDGDTWQAAVHEEDVYKLSRILNPKADASPLKAFIRRQDENPNPANEIPEPPVEFKYYRRAEELTEWAIEAGVDVKAVLDHMDGYISALVDVSKK